MISQHQRRHGLDDGHRPRQDAGIVAAAAFELGVFTGRGDRFLLAHDRRGGLEGDAEDDIFTIGNPTLDAARAVGAYALDVGSSMDETPGVKSHDKIARLFETLRPTSRQKVSEPCA